MMEYMSEKFPMKGPGTALVKAVDYYMGSSSPLEQVMDGLDAVSVQYYKSSSSSPKCSVQAFSLQNAEHHTRIERSSPCDNQNSKSTFNTSLHILNYVGLPVIVSYIS